MYWLNSKAIRQYILAQLPLLKQPARPNIPGQIAPSGQITPLNQTGPTSTPLSGPPYTIPVVVHVINTGGAIGTIYNPTDAQILGAIAYLNAVYNGTEPGTQGAGDLQIQFTQLAQKRS